jgi:hypothetical protein
MIKQNISSFGLRKIVPKREFEVRVVLPWFCLLSHPELEGPVI